MSYPGWNPGASEPPIEGEAPLGRRPLDGQAQADAASHPDAPAPAHPTPGDDQDFRPCADADDHVDDPHHDDHDHDHDEDDDHAPLRTGLLGRLSRESRFGIAAMLSFLVIVSLLIYNRGRDKTKAVADVGRKIPPITQISGGKDAPAPSSKDLPPPPIPEVAALPDTTPPTPEAPRRRPASDESGLLALATREDNPPLPNLAGQDPKPKEGDVAPAPVPATTTEAPDATPAVVPPAPDPATTPATTPVDPNPPAAAPAPASLPSGSPTPEPTAPAPAPASMPTDMPAPALNGPASTPDPTTPAPIPPAATPVETNPTPPATPTTPAPVAEPPANPTPPAVGEPTTPAPNPPAATEPAPATAPAVNEPAPNPPAPTPNPTPVDATPSPAPTPAASTPTDLLAPTGPAPTLPPPPPPVTEPHPRPAPAATPAPAPEIPPLAPATAEAPRAATEPGWVPLPNTRRPRTTAEEERLAPDPEPIVERRRQRERPTPVAAAPAAPADDRPEQVETVPHVVQSGENFWSISQLYYGSGRFYKALWAANRATVPVMVNLRVNQTIRIPPPESLDRSLIEKEPPAVAARPTSGSTASTRPRKPSRPSDPAAGEVEVALPTSDPFAKRRSEAAVDPEADDPAPVRRPTHKVRPYETLRSIARDTLGDSRRADEILELNSDIIDNPAQLVAGQVLELPDDARTGARRPR